MGGITIPNGFISVYTIPIPLSEITYRSRSLDLNVNLFLDIPPDLESHAQAAINSVNHFDEDNYIYIPNVITKKTKEIKRCYGARPLAPPKGSSKRLLAPGLMIPDLRIIREAKEGNDKYYLVMTSKYIGEQEFLVPPFLKVETFKGYDQIRYRGIIAETPKEGGDRPIVIIKGSSFHEPDTHNQNMMKLEEIAKSSSRFWWNI